MQLPGLQKLKRTSSRERQNNNFLLLPKLLFLAQVPLTLAWISADIAGSWVAFFSPRSGTHLGMGRIWQKPYVCPQRILPTSLSACPNWTWCLGLDGKENAILSNLLKKIGVSSLLKIITRCWRKVVLFKTKISVLSLEATSSLLMW